MPAVPLVIAHRGASAQRPEHTLAAYAMALEQGADGVECDVRLTRDGHLVCVHDRRVDRTSTGRGIVSELTLSELAELDYGSWHDGLPEHADELVATRSSADYQPDRRELLTFDALVRLVLDWPGTKLFVETKHPVRYGGLVEAHLVEHLRRYGLADPRSKADSPVVVMSFAASAVRRVRAQAPALPTVLLLDRLRPTRRNGSLPLAADLTGPGIHAIRADPGYVARSRAYGHPTYCWTVDDPTDVRLCRDLGVAFIATNTPSATRAVLLGD